MHTRFSSLIVCTVVALAAAGASDTYKSKVWSPDNGDGTYTNPVINADYSDPDVVAVGVDYYLTASSFCNAPGLPILHSRDLVNWQIINYALKNIPPVDKFATPRHGDGVWAPAIRYHDGRYYIYWGDPDNGIYMVSTDDPAAQWSEPVLVAHTKGVIDTCPLWDEDGRAYLVNGWAKSRSGLNAVLTVTELSPDGTRLIGDPVMVYDGIPDGNHTIEGPKFYKHDGYYYILAPAGGVATGWQVALRSKNVFGPYEMKVVMRKGDTPVNGPHQGAWIRTASGEDWFMHFQDKGIIGRVVHLQPMTWHGGWPVIGYDTDGDGCGTPVLRHKKPAERPDALTSARVNPVESDSFDSPSLGLQWQWNANYALPFGFPSPYGYYRLYSWPRSPEFVNMMETPNILTQKFTTEAFTATAKVRVSATMDGQQAGLIIFGRDYCRLVAEKDGNNFIIKLIECIGADKGKPEKTVAEATLPASEIFGEGKRQVSSVDLWLRVKVAPQDATDKNGEPFVDEVCTFAYSTNGKKFSNIGTPFHARQGVWIGARVGLCALHPDKASRGWIDIDSFIIDKTK